MFNVKDNMAKAKALWETANWDELATYIGPNAEAYRSTFDQHLASWRERGRGPAFALSWHWGAFIPLLGIPWAAARKQWLFIAIMVGAIIFINIVAALVASPTSFGFMLFLVPLMAKQYYVQMALTKVRKIKAELPAGVDVRAALAQAGGINMAYGYIAGAICFGLIALSVVSLMNDPML